MSHDPNADRNKAERAMALAIMKAINRTGSLACSIPRIQDGTVTMDVEDFGLAGGQDVEFTVIISRNDRGQP